MKPPMPAAKSAKPSPFAALHKGKKGAKHPAPAKGKMAPPFTKAPPAAAAMAAPTPAVPPVVGAPDKMP